MNFSVGVIMYRPNVTSYWYRLRCAQRRREGGAIVFGEIRRVRRTARMATRRTVVRDSIALEDA